MKEYKESKGISIPLVWVIVFLAATIWVGFAIGSIFLTGAYIWLAVILGAGIVGGGILYFASAPSRAPEIEELSQSVAQIQQRFESTLAEHAERLQRVEGMTETAQQALEKFSLAIAEYAEQLDGDNAEVRDLNQAAQKLRAAAQEQDRMLSLVRGAITEQPTEPRGEEKLTA